TIVMSDLHPLELLAILGGAVAAALALFAPESRWRLVAAWVLLGTVVATVVTVGPRPEMYSLYLLALITALTAWLASRRVLNAPLRQVWRTGRGSSQEHVTAASGTGRGLLRLLFFAVAMVLLADRKSTRLNSSHVKISYAVFCLKKKVTGRVTLN